MQELHENPPDASALVESLRAFGYSFEAAMSDIVDNAIAANARRIDLHVQWAGASSAVAIADDGDGMSSAELVTAMRLGAKNPLDERGVHDLGRFGLGLKTAAMSQGRRLSVVSRRDGGESILIWDLDTIARTGRWVMENKLGETAETLASRLLG